MKTIDYNYAGYESPCPYFLHYTLVYENIFYQLIDFYKHSQN